MSLFCRYFTFPHNHGVTQTLHSDSKWLQSQDSAASNTEIWRWIWLLLFLFKDAPLNLRHLTSPLKSVTSAAVIRHPHNLPMSECAGGGMPLSSISDDICSLQCVYTGTHSLCWWHEMLPSSMAAFHQPFSKRKSTWRCFGVWWGDTNPHIYTKYMLFLVYDWYSQSHQPVSRFWIHGDRTTAVPA